jgi:NAD+ synthase (glutamine-hydrolysing)
MKRLRIALAQMNPTVGALRQNADRIIALARTARSRGADLVAFPELALTGYPPEDLVLKPRFVRDNMAELRRVAEAVEGIVAVVGFVDQAEDIYNAAAVIADRAVADVYHKIHLPNYGVFDEHRYFQSGRTAPVYRLGDVSFGVSICEDIWFPEGPGRAQALAGAELIININASPYAMGKQAERQTMLATRAMDSSVAVAYLNTVGGQDEVVFDGCSMVLDERGRVVAQAPAFEEDLLVVDVDLDAVLMRRLKDSRRRHQARKLDETLVRRVDLPTRKKASARRKVIAPPMAPMPPGQEEEVYRALCLGVRDYVHKNGFKGTLIGLSGGIDSALVATIAADALGPDNVRTVFMPSRYSSDESRQDAEALARNLGVKLTTLAVEPAFKALIETLAPEFKGRKPDATEENLQARVRGQLLMALSNKTGSLVLTTGNKSEMSVGYATLYGDMAGGFAVIKDVPKTLVYALARWRNAGGEAIPGRIITKAPTAELRPDQKDTDSLPPYDVLDPILRAYIEDERDFDEIVEFCGCKADEVRRVIRMIDMNEYKRRQAPPGIKVTSRAFGKERRMPITNHYRSGS